MQRTTDQFRKRIEVQGVVQGVGFRPFVSSLANRFQFSGLVRNHSRGVTVEVEGCCPEARMTRFLVCLRSEAPPLAQIDSLEVVDISPVGDRTFEIIESKATAGASTPISPDVSTCDDCLVELSDPGDRRYRYPFINCTNCGPRYTIVRDIPYDRPLTTMRDFSMCAECEREYHDPANRRYHAQPNACPKCGPRIWFVSKTNAGSALALNPPPTGIAQQPIDAFHQSISAGQTIALKGIGGFHLACSAEDTTAIQKLRERKGRVNKPFAIMVADLDAALRVAHVDGDEQRLLCSGARPIVLLRRRHDGNISASVAPENAFIGIMLPYSPLHTLLVQRGPLVMTSANLGEEPIVRTNAEAFERLRGLADGFLLHDRDIHAVCDDSLMRVVRGQVLPLRRSRGYAPLPVRLQESGPSVLAVGGELKATFCLTKENYAYLSPHIGDMGNLKTLDAFQHSVDHFQQLFRVRPTMVVCDMHPSYLSRQWALQYADRHGLPLIEVQHHHAHIAAVLAEQCRPDLGRVIGISFDGTGYGSDGAIWGGEVLIASCREYQRWGHLKYLPMPAGESAIKHPYRAALAHLHAAKIPWDQRLPCVSRCSEQERRLLHRQLECELNCVPTSSMGRLFDAVAALVGVRQSVSYEAQASIEMESLADGDIASSPYPVLISESSPCEIDVAPMWASLVEDMLAQTAPVTMIRRFHATVVQLIIELCRRIRAEEGLNDVALSGGVFQNVLILRRTRDRLEELDFNVLTHRIVPPNDGGLALGQAVIAASQVHK